MNLLTDPQIARARQRMQTDAGARAVGDSILRAAEPWIRRDDQLLRDLIPAPRIPRSFSND